MGTARAYFCIMATVLTLGSEALPAPRLTKARQTQSQLTGLLVGPHTSPLKDPVLRPFSSDGCSLSPNGVPFEGTDWLECCVNHDLKYWIGGTADDRRLADEGLKQCIQSKGFPKVAELYFLGVRLGGVPNLPTTYRWGYGWNRQRPYAPLTESETHQAEILYGKKAEILKELIEKHQIPVQSTIHVYESTTKAISSEEFAIYDHLRSVLDADQIILKANWKKGRGHEKIFYIYLSDCPSQPIRYTVDGNNAFDVQFFDSRTCRLKDSAPTGPSPDAESALDGYGE